MRNHCERPARAPRQPSQRSRSQHRCTGVTATTGVLAACRTLLDWSANPSARSIFPSLFVPRNHHGPEKRRKSVLAQPNSRLNRQSQTGYRARDDDRRSGSYSPLCCHCPEWGCLASSLVDPTALGDARHDGRLLAVEPQLQVSLDKKRAPRNGRPLRQTQSAICPRLEHMAFQATDSTFLTAKA